MADIATLRSNYLARVAAADSNPHSNLLSGELVGFHSALELTLSPEDFAKVTAPEVSNTFTVPVESDSRLGQFHEVTITDNHVVSCSCEDNFYRGNFCKHMSRAIRWNNARLLDLRNRAFVGE